ncbi:MAG: hypothetical protein IJR65_00870 [Oscillospiraceae bacterium]|nr:hypothetical protein [Oscillospiraceae bacterium]
MKIVLGYVLTFGWVFLMIGVAQALSKRIRGDEELSRKLIHVSVAFSWVPMALCFGTSWHLIVPPAVFIVLNAISYQKNLFSAMERTDESKKSLGTVYYAISMTVMAVWTTIMPECLPAYGAGLFCMALGDGFAPLTGQWKRGNRKLFGGRTLYGSLTVFAVSLLVVGVFAAVYALPLSFGELLLTALAAAALELVGVRGLDNLSLPLGVFLLVFLFALG